MTAVALIIAFVSVLLSVAYCHDARSDKRRLQASVFALCRTADLEAQLDVLTAENEALAAERDDLANLLDARSNVRELRTRAPHHPAFSRRGPGEGA